MNDDKENMILGRYRPIETAGVGGYGTVIHAYDTRLKREVAIKTVLLSSLDEKALNSEIPQEKKSILGDSRNAFPEDSAGLDSDNNSLAELGSNERRSFKDDALGFKNARLKDGDSPEPSLQKQTKVPGLSEAQAAARLTHPNIVMIYDCEVADDTVYVIEEYVEGITLTQLMRYLQDDINLDIIAHVFKSVSAAIMAAHKAKILHLDIKPDNILIGRGGDVKVADFGLATLMDLNGKGSAAAGTIGYMPLEQMQKMPLDVRSDEWSLAIITYEMLTGSNPFTTAKTLSEAEESMMNSELIIPSACWENLNEGADDALFKALSVDRENRFASIRQFNSALKLYLGEPKLGKKELSVIVNGNEDNYLDTSTIDIDAALKDTCAQEAFVDRLGEKGAKLIAKAASALSSALVIGFIMLNIRFSVSDAFGVLSFQPAAFVTILLVVALLTFIFPRYASLAAFASIVILLCFYQCWPAAILLAVITGLWWVKLGEKSFISTFCALSSLLLGAFGLAPVAIALSGALLGPKKGTITASFISSLSFFMAVFGSQSMFGWYFFDNMLLPSSTVIANQKVWEMFMSVVTNPASYMIAVCWIAASAIFSLFCAHGTKTFDFFGSLTCFAILVLSSLLPWVAGLGSIVPANVVSACAGGVVGLLCCVVNLTDRVRLEPGLW